MTATNIPLPLPGLTAIGIVHPSVQALVTQFNAEGLNALNTFPPENVAWANIGTRVTPGMFTAQIPVALTALLSYAEFTGGERFYHDAAVAAVSVKAGPFDLNAQYDIRFVQAGIGELVNYHGLNNLPANMINLARAHKANMLASLIMRGFTNSALGVTATAKTLAQPNYPNGLPLFLDGVAESAAQHFANPLDGSSATFKNFFTAVGKLDEGDVFDDMLVSMNNVPHPTIANMTLGLGVTDIIGPTSMLKAFKSCAVRSLSLQTTTFSGTDLAAATSNIRTNDALLKAAQSITAAGINPIRYHIAPQLNQHPYVVANPTKQMWIAVSQTVPGAAWAEFLGPSKDFTPRITILGDGSEEAAKYRKVRIISDLDAGVAAGLPHFVQMYFET
jgi:hypothetical protein